MEFEELCTKFSENDQALNLTLFCALSLDELNDLIQDAHLSKQEIGQARLYHPSSKSGEIHISMCCMVVNNHLYWLYGGNIWW